MTKSGSANCRRPRTPTPVAAPTRATVAAKCVPPDLRVLRSDVFQHMAPGLTQCETSKSQIGANGDRAPDQDQMRG